MTTKLLSIENVTFHYFQRHGLRVKKRTVLNNLQLDVYQGEVLGVIGRNGCGKSTLLKLLAGIYQPDKGRIVANNVRVSLQTLNAGFDNALSGRDNALISAMLLGHCKAHALSQLEEINDMAELRDQFDEPVKTYSAGMRARLGFSIAIKMQTDVLLIDEVLGVGDAAFRSKAEQIIDEKIRSGLTVILVSHAVHQIRRLCTRAILIENGKIIDQGGVDGVLSNYEKTIKNTIG
ncbi:ABC transporter ATP-binding protein [Aestuariibacter halophilus]|uniref:ABC transporter ATP-binding protein n=1 Tax=Fluctibacter halophilus TaxID=226011 RepID=A0ABS8G9I6_9ALTE|nr:ABC transporter ATP-binding protein [Aestuariibacter halophilus]MCC2617237.1 ABC transporter ATP-binding protein [Aestuariibacter halophilus]